MRTVAEVMSTDPPCLRATQTLRDAAREVLSRGLRHLPVTDETGRLVGLVHDFQLLRHAVWRDGCFVLRPEYAGLPVLRAAVSVGFTARPGTPVRAVLSGLAEGWEEAVVVVDPARRPVGLFAVHDALRLASAWLGPGWRVRHAATPDGPAYPVEAPAREVLRRMGQERRPHALVRDGEEVVGTISLRELVACDPRSDAPLGERIRRGSSRAVAPEASLADAARALAEVPGLCLPVRLDPGWGLLTPRDVLRAVQHALGARRARSA